MRKEQSELENYMMQEHKRHQANVHLKKDGPKVVKTMSSMKLAMI
jgi:hypothetical protein